METILREDRCLADSEKAEIGEIYRLAFSDQGPEGITWASEPGWTVMVKVDGRVVSCVGILTRRARVGETPAWLGGIGGVATLPNFRRQGYARLALERAAAFLREELGVDFGLLICDPRLTAYYGRLGWQWAADSLVVEQPQGRVVLEAATLVLPCRSQVWPAGTIDLCGYPW